MITDRERANGTPDRKTLMERMGEKESKIQEEDDGYFGGIVDELKAVGYLQ
jgi:hypothetical protein